jgi:hypothetical protein
VAFSVGRPKLIKVDVTDARGLGGAKAKTVSVRTRIPDILAYRGTPGFAYLLLAANPDVPVPTLTHVLEAVGAHQERPAKWMYERRQLFKAPALPDSYDDRIVSLVRANMKQPAWKLRALLRRQGIKCSIAKLYRIRMSILYSSVID